MAAVPNQPTIDLREPGGWRRSKNQIATWLMYLAFVIILIPLGLVIYEVIAKGAKAISWQFLTNSTIPPNVMPLGQGGMGAAVVGTLEITGFAALIAVPLGILGAVYVGEYGGRSWLAKLVSFMADVMVGVPSIVMGLFIFTIWVIPRGLAGTSGFAGSLALACLMLPLIIRSTFEMLKLVPNHLREASYALGATKSRVTLTVVLPPPSAASSAGRCSRSPGRPARRRRCCSPSARSSRPTPTCSAAPPPRCPRRSSATRCRPTWAQRSGPGARH